ncbi:MAG TPA: hypothetical protein VHC91_02440 [Trinickia sp.]|uniref:hypothetical protein n=1 Tax=Trinickia sp. TaxID=2571163 RepID=UPI002C5D7182|nr:hypothetical protein [Trinickia sp.]HVW49250.1 hypothetical protein [Trinickia sp.]
MTVGRALPRLRARVAAVAIAGAVASLTVTAEARAQGPLRERSAAHHQAHHRYLPPQRAPLANPAPPAASAPIVRTGSMPGEFSDHQRDGHMTADERRLLRQHIEDAVRELYKR